jgi:hypothetical protein
MEKELIISILTAIEKIIIAIIFYHFVVKYW